MRNWVILPGGIRDLNSLSGILNRVLDWRRRGLVEGIVLSTWDRHVSGRPELAAVLRTHGVIWLETEEPGLVLAGHVLHQMKANLMALHACPEGCNILKLRTDKLEILTEYSGSNDVENALAGRMNLMVDLGGGWPDIYQQRVVAFHTYLPYPFFMADMAFFGARSDLLKMINFDLQYLFVFRNLLPEQWFHSHAFIRSFPIFRSYFYMAPGLVRSKEVTQRLMAAAFESPFFVDVFASWLVVLSRYFRCGFMAEDDPRRAEVARVVRGMSYREFLFSDLPDHSVTYASVGIGPYCRQDAWLAPFLRGELRMDDLGRRILDAVERVSHYGFHTAYPDALLEDTPAMRDLAVRLEAAVGSEPSVWRMSRRRR